MNKTLIWRLAVSLFFFSGLVIFINLIIDLNPNKIQFDVFIPEGYQQPTIQLDVGEFIPIFNIGLEDFIPLPLADIHSFAVSFNQQPMLTSANFILEDAKAIEDQLVSSWFAYIPFFNTSYNNIDTYIITLAEGEVLTQFSVDENTWLLESSPAGVIAFNPEDSGGGGAIRITKTAPAIQESLDIRNVLPGVSAVYEKQGDATPIEIKSITIAKHFGRLGITLPLKIWSPSDLQSAFELSGAVSLPFNNTDFRFIPDGDNVDFSLNFSQSMTEVAAEVTRVINRYLVFLYLCAFVLSALFYWVSGKAFKVIFTFIHKHQVNVSNLFDRFKEIIQSLFNNKDINQITISSLIRVFVLISLLAIILPLNLPPTEAFVVLILFTVSYYLSYQKSASSFTKNQSSDLVESIQHSKQSNRATNFTIGLLFALITAFLLRFINLTILDPYTDEYLHMAAAQTLLASGQLTYTRAELVTRLVAIFYRIGGAESFYEYLFWGRLPGVIFGTLTTIPIYLLGKKISNRVGLVAAFLWATSPWAIGVSKTIREYAFYPFFILIMVILLLKGFELVITYRKIHIPILLVITLSLYFFVRYAFVVDTLSTLRVSAVIFMGAFLYFLITNLRILLFDKIRKKPVIIGMIIILGLIVFYFMLQYATRSGQVSLQNFEFSGIWVRYFFQAPLSPMHWWSPHHYQFIGSLFVITGAIWALKEREKLYVMPVSIFAVMLLFYTFFFDRYVRPRYIFYILPFYILLVAISVVTFVDFVRKKKKALPKALALIFSTVFFLQAFNFYSITYPIRSDNHNYVLPTNEHHDKLSSSVQFLEEKISDQDVFITTIFRYVLSISFDIPSNSIYSYRYRNPGRFDEVVEVIAENPQGFMILDWRRNGHFSEGFPLDHPFIIADTFVQLVQNKDGMHIYRWER